MNVADVGAELQTQLNTIVGLRCYLGPPDSVSVPAAVVAMPDEITYDRTYGRGADEMVWPVLLLAARVSDRNALERIGAYCDGSGTFSVKAVLENETAAYTAFDSVRVAKVQFDVVTWQGTDFQGALFELHIFGSGVAEEE